MVSKLFSSENIKKLIVHLLLLLLFTSIVVAVNPHFPYYYNRWSRIITYMLITGIALFYIHALVLLPIWIKENNKEKYLAFTIACILIYYLIQSWFGNLLIELNPSPNILSSYFDNLLNIKQLMILFVVLSIPLITITFLSLIYTSVTLGGKRSLSFLEFIVNALIVSIIYITIIAENDEVSIILASIVFLVFYVNTFLLTPILIKERKTSKYVLQLVVLSAGFYILILGTLDNLFFDADTLENIFQIIFNLTGILFGILLFSFIYGYVRLKLEAKERLYGLKLGAKESELNLLKSQINPHFLFNTLNTLYATALEENASKTGESIAKLASLIRYMQEDINKDFIPLKNEVKYLQDYITIQKLRCVVTPQVEMSFKNIENHSISPGLLIPFVENAFKYGIIPSESSKLQISVICDKNTITFECINSYDEDYKTYYKEKGFGIGIKNAKQQLELVYPKKHTFETLKGESVFSVKISINTIKI